MTKRGDVEDYIKKGLEKGFSLGYIREVLVKHGHHPNSVEVASNNIAGLRVPDKIKPSLEEDSEEPKKTSNSLIFPVFGIILLIVISLFLYSNFSERKDISKAQNQLEEINKISKNIDDLRVELGTQQKLIQEKDLTLFEKENIIKEQIRLIDEINLKIEKQKTKLNALILDIMNRMIGRMSE